MSNLSHDQIYKILMSLTLAEANELNRLLRDRGILAHPVDLQVGSTDSSLENTETLYDESSEFDLYLTDVGNTKINVIRVVREVVGGIGMKAAKELVERDSAPIGEGVSWEEAKAIEAKFAEAGASVEVFQNGLFIGSLIDEVNKRSESTTVGPIAYVKEDPIADITGDAATAFEVPSDYFSTQDDAHEELVSPNEQEIIELLVSHVQRLNTTVITRTERLEALITYMDEKQ